MKKCSIFLSILTAITITFSTIMLPVSAAETIDGTTTSTETSTTSEEKSDHSTDSSIDSGDSVSSETSESQKTDITKSKTTLRSTPKAPTESESEDSSKKESTLAAFAEESIDTLDSEDMGSLMEEILGSIFEDGEISEEDIIEAIKELSNMTLKDFMLMEEELKAPLKENRPANESLVWLSEYSNISLSAEKVEGTMPKSGWVPSGTVLELPKVYEHNMMGTELVEMTWFASVFPRTDLDQNICDLLGITKLEENPTESQLTAFLMRFMTELSIYMMDHYVDITDPSYTVPEGSLVLLDGLDPEEYYEQPEEFYLTLDANGGTIKNPDEAIWNYTEQQDFPHILYWEPGDNNYDYDQTDFDKVILNLMCEFGFEKEISDLITPTRKNYTFKGWSTQKLDAYDKGKTDSSKLISYPFEEKEDMADVTLYAVWERTETSSNPKTSDSVPYIAFLFLCISAISLPIMRKKTK